MEIKDEAHAACLPSPPTSPLPPFTSDSRMSRERQYVPGHVDPPRRPRATREISDAQQSSTYGPISTSLYEKTSAPQDQYYGAIQFGNAASKGRHIPIHTNVASPRDVRQGRYRSLDSPSVSATIGERPSIPGRIDTDLSKFQYHPATEPSHRTDEDDISNESTEDDGLAVDESEKTGAERLAEKRKMKRFRLTHAQTRYLMNEFAHQAHPDAIQRERLSNSIPGLSPRQVQVWFQNRRAKLKRLNAEDQYRMMSSRALPKDFGSAPSSSGEQRPSPIFVPPLADLSLGDTEVTSISQSRGAMQRHNSMASVYSSLPPSANSGTSSFMLSPTSSINDGSQFSGSYHSEQASPYTAMQQFSNRMDHEVSRTADPQQPEIEEAIYSGRFGGQSLASQRSANQMYSTASSLSLPYQRSQYQDFIGPSQYYSPIGPPSQQVSAAGSAGPLYYDAGGMRQDTYAQTWQYTSAHSMQPSMRVTYPHAYNSSDLRRGGAYPTYYQDPRQS